MEVSTCLLTSSATIRGANVLFGCRGDFGIEVDFESHSVGLPISGHVNVWIAGQSLATDAGMNFLAPFVLKCKKYVATDITDPESSIQDHSDEFILSAVYGSRDPNTFPFCGLSEDQLWDLIFLPSSPPFHMVRSVTYRLTGIAHFVWSSPSTPTIHRAFAGIDIKTIMSEFIDHIP